MSQPPESNGHSDHLRQLKNPDGSWKYTNPLIRESSPYLLQHAHNPVDWRPWGPEAFELARAQDKPIFLSVGYSTCYWCHVMERQVFESPELARLMNQHMVNIKVDREERPDVDDIYMIAVQMLTQRGGWPMSVFLTPPGAAGGDDPGLKPFWAGTYIPPQPQYGMPGFGEVVTQLAAAYRDQKEAVIEQAQRVADAVAGHLGRVDEPTDLTVDVVSAAANQLLRNYESTHGGFSGAPKFPQPSNIAFLLHVYQNNPSDNLWQAISYTLERMARGGLYDQIGGGFHRYSTDEEWLVPHFEKMLYDNGQLVELYTAAHAIRPDKHDSDLYLRIARETCDYVIREMTDSSGAYWSAQDAEVDAREGGNYVWTPQEIRETLRDPSLGDLALRMYGLDRGTNFQDPHHADAPATNVLYLPERLDELASAQNMELQELLERRSEINQRMLTVRNLRPQPGTDDKVLTSWNGLMIAGMARAARATGQPRYLESAMGAARCILSRMRAEDGSLFRTMRAGQARIPAFLEDYAFLVHGLIELFRSTQDRAWLLAAVELTDAARDRFAAAEHDGGYFDTLPDQADLFVRVRSYHDGALPSGNSQMVHNLIDLHEITSNQRYLEQALTDLRSFAVPLRQQGAAMAHMQHALLRIMEVISSHEAAVSPQEPGQPGSRRQALAVEVTPHRLDLSSGSAPFEVRLLVHPEYHINAAQVSQEGWIPTQLMLSDGAGVELAIEYPAGTQRKYPLADGPMNVYEGEVTLRATLRRSGSVTGQPQVLLRYQPCTDSSCLEARTVQLPLEIVGLE